jgi:SSS family solute:Na+ symporter
VGIWYWCTDQYIVQRTLSAKNLQTARRGALWGAFLKVWPVLIFLVPGLIGYALHTKGAIQIPLKALPDGTEVINGDQVFPTLVTELLPRGLRGLVVGGLLAALMSSLSSLFNSCAMLFTVDIYEKIRPETSERHLVTVGRIATTTIVLLGIIWIPVMKGIAHGGLYQYLQSVQGYLAPPITAVFLLGLFSRRTNAHGAVAGLGLGFLLGMTKLALEAMSGSGAITGGFLKTIGDYNFLFASGWLFGITVAVVTVVSRMTPAQPMEQIGGLTYSAFSEQDRKEIRASWNWWDITVTAIVLGLVLALYVYFSFWI